MYWRACCRSNLAGGAPGCHGACRIGAPLAPGAGVEQATVHARVGHRQQIVAARDAGAAMMDHIARVPVFEQRGEFFAQLLARFEGAVGLQIGLKEAVFRPGNMPTDRINRLDFARISLRRARVQNEVLAAVQVDEHAARRHGAHQCGATSEVARDPSRWRRALARAASGRPDLPAAVEHGHRVVAEPAQHPPQAHGKAASGSVVSDDLLVLAQAELGESGCEGVGIRQRVPTVVPAFWGGQIAVEVKKDRARNMGQVIGLLARFGLGEVMTAVDDESVTQCGQFGGGNQGGVV